MGWYIAEFSDLTVSRVSVKWMRKKGKKCWFPKTNVLKKIKNETEVDEKSDKWSLHSCRLLMNGEKYETFELARNAELIAQNHSTMASFERSKNRKSRKRPKKHFDSSSSSSSSPERGNKDFENKKILSKLDETLAVNLDKSYNYDRDDSPCKENDSQASSSEDEKDHISESDGSQSSKNHTDRSGSIDLDKDESEVSDYTSDDFSEDDGNSDDGIDAVNSNDDDRIDADDGNDTNKSLSVENESDFLHEISTLESTERIRSPASSYDFSEERRMVRLEKLIMNACQLLESIKTEVTEIKKKSVENEAVVNNLVLVSKDLSIEVFTCVEEIKKRNGLFTDILAPDLKLPIKKRKVFFDVELALGRHKIVDNLIKYIASTINETKEVKFIQASFKVIFDIKFLANKVWWKKQPGKVLFKNSQILHCMKESFKIKFGLVEPKKTDKDIERLIYQTCRNLKDGWRKAKKSKEAANTVDQHEKRKKDEKAEKKKKKKEAAERAAERAQKVKERADEARLASEEATRAAENKLESHGKKRKAERGNEANDKLKKKKR